MTEKQCSRCKLQKQPGEFYKNKARADGMSTYCKQCTKLWLKEHALSRAETQAKWWASLDAQTKKTYLAARPKQSAWAASNPARRREIANAYKRRAVAALAPAYIVSRLGLPSALVSDDLLALKRDQLTLRRLARELRKANDESSKEPG